MPRTAVNKHVMLYVRGIAHRWPEITSIWLFGSRANENAHNDSDWDMMVFADRTTFVGLKTDILAFRAKADVFVVIDGNNFRSPWDTIDHSKRGGKLTGVGGWQWQDIGDGTAEYDAAQRPYNDKRLPKSRKHAICLFKRRQNDKGGK